MPSNVHSHFNVFVVCDCRSGLRCDSTSRIANLIYFILIFVCFDFTKATSSQGRIRQEQYNVLFITIDDLSRVQDVFPTYTKKGVTFSSVYTTGSTHGGIHAALFGGEDVYQSEMYEKPSSLSLQREGATQNWLPSILQQKEYTTAAFVSHHDFQKKFGWSQGFGSYGDEMLAPSGLKECFWFKGIDLFSVKNYAKTTKAQ